MSLFSYSEESMVLEKVKVFKEGFHVYIYKYSKVWDIVPTNAYALKAGSPTCCATSRTWRTVEGNCVTGEIF